MELLGHIKRTEKLWFLALLGASTLALLGTMYSLIADTPKPERLANTFGILLTLAGLIQLEISGVFEKLAEIFSDDEKYPSGPPSYYCRETMIHEDDPLPYKLKEYFFFQPKTGFWLVVAGTSAQLVATWL